jgi:hypothetical protein
MQHPAIGHDAAKSPVTFREIRSVPSVKWNTPGSNGFSGKQCFDRVWKRFLIDNYTGKRPSLGTIFFHAQELGWIYPSGHNTDDFGADAR